MPKLIVSGIASFTLGKPGFTRNDNERGISILEVIAAIMIITLGLVGILSLAAQSVKAQYIDKNVLTASGLAGEAVELVRNIRDLNWLTPGNSWSQNIVGDGSYTIDYGGLSSINTAVNFLNDAGARLYTDSNGFYTHVSAGNTPTNFYRLVSVIDHTDYLDIKCVIRWQDGSQYHDYTVETYLYDWR